MANIIPNDYRFNTISGLHESTIIRIEGPKGPGDIKFVTIKDLDDNFEQFLEDGYNVQIYDFEENVFKNRGLVDVNRTDEPVEMKKITLNMYNGKRIHEFIMTPDTIIRAIDLGFNPDNLISNPYQAMLVAQFNRAMKEDPTHFCLCAYSMKTLVNIECKDITIETYSEKCYGYDIVLDTDQEDFFPIGKIISTGRWYI